MFSVCRRRRRVVVVPVLFTAPAEMISFSPRETSELDLEREKVTPFFFFVFLFFDPSTLLEAGRSLSSVLLFPLVVVDVEFVPGLPLLFLFVGDGDFFLELRVVTTLPLPADWSTSSSSPVGIRRHYFIVRIRITCRSC